MTLEYYVYLIDANTIQVNGKGRKTKLNGYLR